MAPSELAFEYLAVALEATRGTAIAAPTHYLPLDGMMTPTPEFYMPTESRGTLEEFYRQQLVRNGMDWTGEGGADPNYAPLLFNMVVKAVTSPSTPTNGVLTRLWEFVPAQTADNIKTATMWWGDPNNQIFRSTYAYANEFSLDWDATGTDGVTWSVSGSGQPITQVADPTLPAQTIGSLLMPQAAQIWLDTGEDDIGTTALADRVVSGNFSLSKNIGQKRFAQGPGGSLGFSRLGRGRFHAESTITLELADMTEYDIFAAGTTVKLRVRLNGDLIESVTPDYYEYLEYDVYGKLTAPSWGETAGTNRTITFTVLSMYDATLGASWALRAQNTKTSV
jgi:hypothetical protein